MRVLGRPVLTAAIVLCGVTVAGCATGGTAAGPVGSASSAPMTGTVAPSSGGALPTPGAVTLAGVATRGALPSCVVLTAADGRHFVLLGAPSTPLGVPISVVGTAEPGSASQCNAGTPVQVSAVQRR